MEDVSGWVEQMPLNQLPVFHRLPKFPPGPASGPDLPHSGLGLPKTKGMIMGPELGPNRVVLDPTHWSHLVFKVWAFWQGKSKSQKYTVKRPGRSSKSTSHPVEEPYSVPNWAMVGLIRLQTNARTWPSHEAGDYRNATNPLGMEGESLHKNSGSYRTKDAAGTSSFCPFRAGWSSPKLGLPHPTQAGTFPGHVWQGKILREGTGQGGRADSSGYCVHSDLLSHDMASPNRTQFCSLESDKLYLCTRHTYKYLKTIIYPLSFYRQNTLGSFNSP